MTVYLVGAGPGDSKLMTVKGLEVLRNAEVVLYDRLVNPIILQEVRDDAELIYCGKLPNRHILRQESINQLLVEKGLAGKRVVRLKGGDPGVFGRVGEEAEALKDAGVSYEIVPGITSGIAAAAYAGIPVTHREFGTSFAVVTGHDKSTDGKPLINWDKLANGIDTIAFYMGVKNLTHITEQLISHGRSPSTGVAVIQWGTTGRQKVVAGTLETIVTEVEKNQVSNPAITLVGNIINLREKLQWFETKKFLGERFVFPYGSSKMVEELSEDGAEVIVYPRTMVIDRTRDKEFIAKLSNIQLFNKITFSSKDAFSLFLRSLIMQKIDIRAVSATFFTLNREVKEFIEDAGFFVELIEKPIKDNHHLLVCSNEECRSDDRNVLVTHSVKNSPNQSIVFKRMMEEASFTGVIFTSRKAILSFIKQLEEDGYNFLQFANHCQIYAENEETIETLKSIFPNYQFKHKDFREISRGLVTI